MDVTSTTVAGAGTCLASTWTDYDQDGDCDIFVGNDFGAFVEPNQIYRNNGPDPSGQGWSFSSVSEQNGANAGIFCMGIAIGDIDRDLDFDYYFTNLGRNVLLRNDRPVAADGIEEGDSVFVDITDETGTTLTYDPKTSNPVLFATSWGTGFHDFDNDGWLDLYVSNGFVPASPQTANGKHTANVVFRHDGPAMTFTEMPCELDDRRGRGAAFSDFDRDGDQDVLQVNVDGGGDGGAVLLRNDSPALGNWFAPRLHGRLSNRDAIGAIVDVELDTWIARREVCLNYSYESSSTRRLHFGLGGAEGIRSAEVVWPSGITQQFYELSVNEEAEWYEPFVTIDKIVVASREQKGGRERWELTAELVNHADRATRASYTPRAKLVFEAPPNSNASSNAFPKTQEWTGKPIQVDLQANGRSTIRRVVNVPTNRPGLVGAEFVWTVTEGPATDQARVELISE